MRQFKQFITYRADFENGKWQKRPTDPLTGFVCDAQDPKFWVSYEEAVATGRPVGFVLTNTDPYFCLDIDNCLLSDNRTWSPEALAVVAAFPGAMVEVSMSGRGLHIWGRYRTPIPEHGKKNTQLGLELYHEKRFIALGRPGASGNIETDCTAVLEKAILAWFPPSSNGGEVEDWTDAPVPGWTGPVDDDELIRRALHSGGAAAAFGKEGKASFKDLWEANAAVLARAYPSETGQPFDASSADMALANHLSFWTGKNCERMKRLMLRSGLKRDKWEREAYLDGTISRAAQMGREVYDKVSPGTGAVTDPDSGSVTGWPPAIPKGLVWPEQQALLFAGCTYVADVHKVLVPGGRLWRPEQFKTFLGGYSFPMDAENSKISRDAWEAFTQSQLIPVRKADTACFRPDLPVGEVIERDGLSMVNTWWPVAPERKQGDVSRFLAHLAKILPVKRDRDILVAYMAALVQYPGVKFKWAPFIQGAPGNGKTLFSECIAHAVGRRYSHFPKARDIDAKFNAWMYGKLFIGVEDIYVPEKREDVVEALKPMITGEWLEIEGKGENQVTREICCNFLINSNHKDGLRKIKSDRRFAPFFTAQQSAEDIVASGMGGYYFPDLYRWLGKEGGYSMISEYLYSYPIPDELNPALFCHRAPETSSTEEAIEYGLGSVEQEIMEAVSQGVPGFCGGWVSSTALDALLERLRATKIIPINRRRGMMKDLGYDWHPALQDGRVTQKFPDGHKPRLYVQKDHWSLSLRRSTEIVKAFQDAQAGVAPLHAVPSPTGVFGLPQ